MEKEDSLHPLSFNNKRSMSAFCPARARAATKGSIIVYPNCNRYDMKKKLRKERQMMRKKKVEEKRERERERQRERERDKEKQKEGRKERERKGEIYK